MAKIGNLYNSNRINLGEAIPLETPFVIQIEPTGFCNLRCNFCPSGDENSGIKRDVMSMETFELFINQCMEFKDKIKALRIIGIGEPLLNKNIVKFVELAKKSQAFEKVEITTNATLLNNALSESLVDAGLDTILVSLEGLNSESYKNASGVDIDVNELFNNIRYLYQNRKQCKVYIKTVDISIKDEKEKENFFTKWGDICDEIQIEHVYSNWPEFYCGDYEDSVRFDDEVYARTKRVCVQPFKLLCVAANGDVMPCSVDWKRKHLLGNISENKMTEIWNGEKLKQLRIDLLKGQLSEYCRACSVTKSNQPDCIDDSVEAILERL